MLSSSVISFISSYGPFPFPFIPNLLLNAFTSDQLLNNLMHFSWTLLSFIIVYIILFFIVYFPFLLSSSSSPCSSFPPFFYFFCLLLLLLEFFILSSLSWVLYLLLLLLLLFLLHFCFSLSSSSSPPIYFLSLYCLFSAFSSSFPLLILLLLLLLLILFLNLLLSYRCYRIGNRAVVRFRTRLMQRLRLRSCLFCEGRISVLKRWFKTPIENAVNSGYCSSSSEPERRLYDVI